MTTYEQKMLEIFAARKGEALSEELVRQLEKECDEQVWRHFPSEVRRGWRFALGISEQGELELRPTQLSGGEVPALEAALVAPFQEQDVNPAIQNISLGFGTSHLPEVPRPSQEERERLEIRQQNVAPTEERGGRNAQDYLELSKEVGVSLPSNESLLGPWMEAVEAAAHYKARALSAEAKLQDLLKLLNK